MMKKETKKAQKLISLFLISLLLMNFPLLSLFNTPSLLGSIPLLYVYIFGAWLVLIIIIGLIINKKEKPKHHA